MENCILRLFVDFVCCWGDVMESKTEEDCKVFAVVDGWMVSRVESDGNRVQGQTKV